MYKVISFFVVSVASLLMLSCEKDTDRCKCTDSRTGDSYETSVEDQECNDLDNGTYRCYPAD